MNDKKTKDVAVGCGCLISMILWGLVMIAAVVWVISIVVKAVFG